ncbi:MAG: NAD-dependent epimerase/dehydratase family protein, partial [Chloroflexi bacterium]|nr:NAD-dependent epimerase/dehydratase family protein [Chloroflexota bacterium]
VGISRARRHVLQEGNVDLTARVLGAARTVGLAKVVYVSTVAVFGDTHGATADEKFVRTGEWTSYYDRTKTRAHTLALEATAGGLPLVIVQPGQLFGPGGPLRGRRGPRAGRTRPTSAHHL